MLETFNFRVLAEYLPLFFRGLLATGWISLIALFGALIFGIIACMARISGRKVFSAPAVAYIEIIRSTPLLVQLYFFYFGLPSLGIGFSEHQTGILALSLNSGAYMAEILRAGILSVPRGQSEAGTALAMNYYQRLQYIILPQAVGMTIPPLLGQTIVLVKDSALLSLISVFELTRASQVLTSERFMPAEAFLTTAFFYLVLYYILKTFSSWYQGRLIYRGAA